MMLKEKGWYMTSRERLQEVDEIIEENQKQAQNGEDLCH